MAKAYQSGDTTACYSVSVSACKGLPPATLATRCYVFTRTQPAKLPEHIFQQNITITGIKSFLSKERAVAMWVYCTGTPVTSSSGYHYRIHIIGSKTLQHLRNVSL